MKQDTENRAAVWPWIVGTAAAITILIYGRSLTLPFYSDDLVQIPWLRTLRFADLWREVSPYSYYRPLAFSLWLVLRDLGLAWTPAGLRLLNLAFHAAAASLVGALAWEMFPLTPTNSSPRRRGDQIVGAAGAAGLFAAFPFAYQAVPWVSAIFYPLSTMLMVLAVYAYLRARASGSAAWIAASVLAGIAAPFAHENGMLTGLLVLLAEGVIWWHTRRVEVGVRFSLWPLAHIATGGVFLLLWSALRPGGVATLDLSPPGLFQNAIILTSGISFPLVWLAQIGGINGRLQIVAIWGLTAGCAAILLWLTRKQIEVGVFCVGWLVILSGPVLVTMRPEWLIDAPRFLYPAGVGAALWWGLALSRLPDQWNAPRLLAAPVLIAAMLPGAIFASKGVMWYVQGGAALTDAVRAVEAKRGEPLLLVNMPDRITPEKSIFPFFDGGAILLPPQVPAGDIIGTHTGETRQDQAVTAGAILPPVEYRRTTYGSPMEPEAILSGVPVMIADYATEPDIHLREVGQVIAEYQRPREAVATFGSSVVLWEADTVQSGNVLTLTLIWEVISKPQGTPTIFVHIIDVSGTVVAQADGDPVGGLFPLYAGIDQVVVRDVRMIRVPAGASSVARVGVWNPTTGERLPATGGIFVNDEVPVGAP